MNGWDVREAIGLCEAAQLLRGRGGKRPALESLRRWILVGVRVGDEMVKLQARKINNEWLTMPAWVEAFEAARAGEAVTK